LNSGFGKCPSAFRMDVIDGMHFARCLLERAREICSRVRAWQ